MIRVFIVDDHTLIRDGLRTLLEADPLFEVVGEAGNPAPGVSLTHREREILELVASGLTNQQMADQLFTSKRTIESHRQNLLEKTGVSNTAALVKYAMEHGLLQP